MCVQDSTDIPATDNLLHPSTVSVEDCRRPNSEYFKSVCCVVVRWAVVVIEIELIKPIRVVVGPAIETPAPSVLSFELKRLAKAVSQICQEGVEVRKAFVVVIVEVSYDRIHRNSMRQQKHIQIVLTCEMSAGGSLISKRCHPIVTEVTLCFKRVAVGACIRPTRWETSKINRAEIRPWNGSVGIGVEVGNTRRIRSIPIERMDVRRECDGSVYNLTARQAKCG